MKATIENLKANREKVIATLTSLFGEDKLRVTMQMLKEWTLSADENETIEELIDELKQSEILQDSRRKTTKTAEMQGAWMEKNGYTKFNHVTKKYE